VLAQLGNRVQHALRAFTPDDAKALKATASTFPTSEHDLVEVIPALGTGEAIVTVMSEDGTPTPVAITAVRAPESSMDPAGAEAISAVVTASPLAEEYGTPVDRESAYEILAARAEKEAAAEEEAPEAPEAKRSGGSSKDSSRSAKKDEGGLFGSPAVKSFLRSAGTVLGREVTRSLFGTRRRR
ncbi:MAG: helicase HerA-like domain-containing protein, partial [Brachybacterium tyrofermentans]